jgi:hypothetical protein
VQRVDPCFGRLHARLGVKHKNIAASTARFAATKKGIDYKTPRDIVIVFMRIISPKGGWFISSLHVLILTLVVMAPTLGADSCS